MTTEQRLLLMARYEAGPAEVERALAGMPDAQLTAHPIPGKWSAAQIVHHLADSEMTSAIRLRKLVAERHPVLQGYDQDRWAEALSYEERPIGPALDALRAARATSAQVLRRLTDEQWRHLGWHTDAGSYTVERWLEIYADHAHEHAAQIRRLREALGA